MSLSKQQIATLTAAGASHDPVLRQQAVVIVLSATGADQIRARALLGESYVAQTQPSFHLIPRGDSMADEDEFTTAYSRLATATKQFTQVDVGTVANVLDAHPETLMALRMIVGLTYNELAVAVRLIDSTSKAAGGRMKSLEREPRPDGATKPARADLIQSIAEAIVAVVDRQVLAVPPAVSNIFHSKIDKRDTIKGWESVAEHAPGVPYSALLYQRYVGGLWRQVQDAYSEAKGDGVLEVPLTRLLEANSISFYRTKSGASGAAETAKRYGLKPGPDFLIPEQSPTVIIESKVAEDGGTARDKAARIETLASSASSKGMRPAALIDGKGWSERVNALVDIVIATEGRTYSLDTLPHLLDLPEIKSLMP